MIKLKSKIISMLGDKNVKKLEYFGGFKYYNEFKKYKNEKKIIHIMTPVHGNMGDQAIVYATNLYLKNEFKDYKVIEVYRNDVYRYLKSIKKILNKNDIVALIGGGNMGNLWIDEEIDRRFVINKLKNNKIISMPQTISFTDNTEGNQEFRKSINIYNKSNDLTLIARENKSYKNMIKSFNCKNIILNPDMVLYLNNKLNNKNIKRKYIMTCLRNDKEGVLGKDKENLISNLKNKYSNLLIYDTVIDRKVTKEKREEELNNMFDKFFGARVVITDRLHGMVFCAITKTPCIVTKSLDHKVTGTYEWIKDLNYIKLVDNLNFDEVEKLITELSSIKEYSDIDFDSMYFNKLREKIENNERA